MITVEVNFSTTPADRDKALLILQKDAAKARGMRGNRAFRILTDPHAADIVTLLQRWDSMADFDTYRRSPLFAQIGQSLRPMMTGTPQTDINEAQELA